MKTNNTTYIIATVAAAVLAFAGLVKIDGNFLSDAAVGISYLAVGSLFVLAALDNRRGSKSYGAR